MYNCTTKYDANTSYTTRYDAIRCNTETVQIRYDTVVRIIHCLTSLILFSPEKFLLISFMMFSYHKSQHFKRIQKNLLYCKKNFGCV